MTRERDEDFSDIPELGSARDSLDNPSIPTLEKPAVTPPKKAAESSPQMVERRGDGRLMAWVLLLLMVVMGAGGYWGLEHLNRLQKELIMSNQRLAGLEGLINATDENANKSGAALQAQMKKYLQDGEKRIKHVDSELAKLWTVAYQRNKPKIAEVDQAIAEANKSIAALDKRAAELDKRAAALDEQAKALTSELQQARKALDKSLAELEGLTQQQGQDQQFAKSLESQLQLRDQANQELDALQDSQLVELEKQLKAMQSEPAIPVSVSSSLKEQQQAIAAINSFRKQVNSQLLRMGKQLDQLQKSQASATKAP